MPLEYLKDFSTKLPFAIFGYYRLDLSQTTYITDDLYMEAFMLCLSKKAVSHEEVFLSRYQLLVTWSLKMADPDREKAEDLVHDAYISVDAGKARSGLSLE